jgi:acetylornithine deacetylase/succinyl-diaminopimelate desuccinylase-like protein
MKDMKFSFVRRFLVVLFAVNSVAWAETPAETKRIAAVQQRLRTDIEFLSSEELRGRGVDDDASIAKAANYIADQMQTIGLDTTLFDGKPFQSVPLTLDAAVGSAERNLLTVKTGEASEKITATLSDGMSPMAIGSLAGRVVGRLVFAGYGITAPKYDYDDYAGIDAGGAVVFMLRKEPGIADPKSPFGGTRNTRHAFFANKIENAIKHGASAVVLINDPASVERSVQRVRNQINREQKRKAQIEKQIGELPAEAVNSRKTLNDQLASIDSVIDSLSEELDRTQQGVLGVAEAGQRREGKDSIPVASVSRSIANRVLKQATGQQLDQIEAKIDETYQPQSSDLTNVKVVLQVELKPTVAETSNVIGVIAGRGQLADESIVVGAHYDHVGMGGYGSLAPGTIAIHNGADDNASGTAALLASAEQLQSRLAESDAHRRIIYIAFTGEERGLVGSKFYVRSPRFPLESTVAMINMDMVGRLRDNELTIYGTGSSPMMNDILEQVNQRQQFKLFRVATGYGPSDHQSFYEAGIPVMFFFTGLHNDYHRPSDDSEKINFGGLTRITDTVSEVTFQLATRKDRPRYAKTEGLAKIRRQMTAFLGVQLSDRRGRVVLSGVTPGGPAERDGLRVGDTIVNLAGRRMDKTTDVLEQVREQSPQNKIAVRVIRDGNTIDLTVELGTRPAAKAQE